MILSSVVLAAAGTSRAAAPAKPPSKVAGIRTVILPSPSSPLCAVRLFFQVGAVDDPKGKEGLAALTADLLILRPAITFLMRLQRRRQLIDSPLRRGHAP